MIKNTILITAILFSLGSMGTSLALTFQAPTSGKGVNVYYSDLGMSVPETEFKMFTVHCDIEVNSTASSVNLASSYNTFADTEPQFFYDNETIATKSDAWYKFNLPPTSHSLDIKNILAYDPTGQFFTFFATSADNSVGTLVFTCTSTEVQTSKHFK